MTRHGDYVILRARIGISVPTDLDPTALQDRLAAALTTAAQDWGAHIDLLQLGVGLDPAWATDGPPNRVK